MPSDFYGGVGVDLLYPSPLGINQFSEPEWSSANIAPLPATDYSSADTYTTTPAHSRPPPIEVSSVPAHLSNEPRPKSSPSTFGPNVEDLYFPENPFKFRQDDYAFFPSPQPSGKSSPYFGNQEFAAPPMVSRESPQRQMPVPIAPDPVGMRHLQTMKRQRDDDDHEQLHTQSRKRKRAVSSTGPVELNEEETLLLKLKEEENLPWKDIAARFQSDLGKTYQVPALQMRFKRLRERMRAWTENDPNKKPMLNGRGGVPLYGRTGTSAPPNVPVSSLGVAQAYSTGPPRGAYRPMPLPAATMPPYPGSLYPSHPQPYPALSPNSAYAPNYSGPPATSPGTVPSNSRYSTPLGGSPNPNHWGR